jgi:translation initiation factor SUI1
MSDWSDEDTSNVEPIGEINFFNLDQFEDAGRRKNIIHLRFKKRTGKKVLTIVEGLTEEETKKYLKIWKKAFCCTGTKIMKETEEVKHYILQFTGDCRGRIKKYLIDNKIVEEVDIKVHGPITND